MNIINFQCDCIKYSPYLKKKLDLDLSVHYFVVAIARDYKGKHFKEQLLINAYRIVRSVGATSLTYICTSINDQERARRVGFQVIRFFYCGFYLLIM